MPLRTNGGRAARLQVHEPFAPLPDSSRNALSFLQGGMPVILCGLKPFEPVG
jgi:hypothetical protein